jgi:hypothetical protein
MRGILAGTADDLATLTPETDGGKRQGPMTPCRRPPVLGLR